MIGTLVCHKSQLYIILLVAIVIIQLSWNPSSLVHYFHQEKKQEEKRSVSQQPRPRVACFFMVGETDLKHALSVRYAWGRKCTKFVIVANGIGASRQLDQDTRMVDISSIIQEQLQQRGYSKNNKNNSTTIPYTSFPSAQNETKSTLALKSFYSWLAMAELFANDGSDDDMDYIMKADQDTYMHMDNYLKYLQRDFRPNQHAFIGRVFQAEGNFHRPFVSGLSITLSRATLRLLYDQASIDRDGSKCTAKEFGVYYQALEDYALAECLQSLGVYPARTRDSQGRERFMHFNPSFHQKGTNGPDWYQSFSFGDAPLPPSDEACAFHYVNQEHQNDTLVYKSDGLWHWDGDKNSHSTE